MCLCNDCACRQGYAGGGGGEGDNQCGKEPRARLREVGNIDR